MILTREADIAAALRRTRVIAVLGAQRDPGLPAHYVPAYLHQQGYRILPVNPVHVGHSEWGEPFRAHLADLGEPVDMVDVFRRSDALDDHLADFLGLAERPLLVWLQLGIRNDRVAAALAQAGIDVVQDRCAKVDERRFRQAGLLGS